MIGGLAEEMGTNTNSRRVIILAVLLLGTIFVSERPVRGQTQLSTEFYSKTCPAAEHIVRDMMAVHFIKDPRIAAQLLRVQFHDCAATGCDASLLLTGPDSERDAPPNLSLFGFEVLSDIKSTLEARCPRIVSCADIITMAARDAVYLTGGPIFSVPLGRFDSTTSGGINVTLPSPSISVPDAITFFESMGLSKTDTVVLLGGHTIGRARCGFFTDRLFNFSNTNVADPSLEPTFSTWIKASCSNSSGPLAMVTAATWQSLLSENITVPLDPESEFHFDNHYYHRVRERQGVLHIDQELFNHPDTSDIVDRMADNPELFAECFAQALIKMGQVGVKDSTNGTIRTQC